MFPLARLFTSEVKESWWLCPKVFSNTTTNNVPGQYAHPKSNLARKNSIVPTVMSKREASPPPEGVLIKRARGATPPQNQIAISSGDDGKKGLIRTVKRTSGLEAPIVSLTGSHSVCLNVSESSYDLSNGITENTGGDFEL